jgi:hypothetical protein
MVEDVVHDLQVLAKADSLIAKLWLNAAARRFGLLAFAGLIGLFGLGMANLAALYALQPSVGPFWAPAIVAGVDFLLAAAIWLMSEHSKPGPELELVFEVRKMAIDALRADARDMKATLDGFHQDIRGVKESVVGLMQDPLGVASEKVLIPAALSIIKGMRAKKARA